jgi:hypothetical protein
MENKITTFPKNIALKKREVVGTTNRPLSFDTTQTYRKRRLQQFFVAAGKCLPSRCLATAGGYRE